MATIVLKRYASTEMIKSKFCCYRRYYIKAKKSNKKEDLDAAVK
jgi:hypothetical protein